MMKGMVKMSKKCISAILSMLMLFSAAVIFPGCAAQAENSAVTTGADTTPETAELTDEEIRKAIPDNLPEADYDGRNFRIITRDGCSNNHIDDLFMEEMTGDVIDDAVFTRNQTVEERFDAKITVFPVNESDEATLTNMLRKSITAGSDEYDLAVGHMIHIGTSATNGLYYNWYDIPHIDFSKPWWIHSAEEQLAIDGKTFFALGDLTYNALDYTYCYYFNKRLFNDYNLDFPYEDVRNGKWTFDYATSLVRSLYSDINSDGKKDEYDLYGLVTNCYSGSVTWTYAFGEFITKKNADGYPELVINNEKTISIVEKLYNLYFESEGVYVTPNTTSPSGMAWHEATVKLFNESRAVLASGLFISAINDFREIEDDYGFLPYPKWDEEQSGYYTMIDGHGPLFAIPLTINDPDFVGMITEAMSAEGYKTVTPAYYDVALKTKFTRDEESAEMIDLILAGRVFDFGYLYDGWNGMAFYLQNLLGFNTQTKDFSSFYAKKEKAVIKYYDKILKAYEEYGQ